MGELSGRVALVTGTAHGIGTAIANGLEEDGATVHRVDRDTADLTDPAQVARLIARLGRIDILVNNAGGVVGQVGKPLDQVTDEDWRASGVSSKESRCAVWDAPKTSRTACVSSSRRGPRGSPGRCSRSTAVAHCSDRCG